MSGQDSLLQFCDCRLDKKKPRRPIPYGSPMYFMACAASGVVATGGTLTAVTPLDVIKNRMQTNHQKYFSVKETVRVTLAEVFKMKYFQFLGDETAYKYRSLVYLGASCSAEIIGDMVLAPFEAAKVRTQTDPNAPRQMTRCFPLIYQEKGIRGLYKGLPPLMMRQVPYNATQFVTFEFAIEALYKFVVPKPRSQCTKKEQMCVSFMGACVAGFMATMCSHQPDILVSILNKNPKMSYREAIRLMVKNGIWKGLQARLMMVATAAATQLFVVDATKVLFNLEMPKRK